MQCSESVKILFFIFQAWILLLYRTFIFDSTKANVFSLNNDIVFVLISLFCFRVFRVIIMIFPRS